jgi:uncharacterized membrane protein (DUF373 family)
LQGKCAAAKMPSMLGENMLSFLKKFEKIIINALIIMMSIVVFLATIELAWIIAKDFMKHPMFLLEIGDLLEIFGFFMLVLIGIELLETIKAYLTEQVVHVEIVLEVALIAIARKVIILDIEKYNGLTIIGTAGLILAVAAAYYAVKRRLSARSA